MKALGFDLLGTDESVFHQSEHGIESCWIANGDFRQALAIEFDLGHAHPVDELAIAETTLAASGIQTNDPELAELTLLGASIAKREIAGAEQRLLDRTEQLATAADVSLGSFTKTFVSSRTS